MARPIAVNRRQKFSALWNAGVHANRIAKKLGYKDADTVYVVASKWKMGARGRPLKKGRTK